MKLITRNSDYAIRVVCYLAKVKTRLVSSEELFGKLKIPYPFLRRILLTLRQRRVLTSYKGRGGGFRLAIKPDRLNVIRLLAIFQGEFDLANCVLGKKICPQIKQCCFRKKLKEIEGKILGELEQITIGGLVNETKNHKNRRS